ncbi:MAG TPA: ATP-binding protein [Candidatus Competibacter sp.]|nr:ATP-binding protein [Candidatus Competibacter sp.]
MPKSGGGRATLIGAGGLAIMIFAAGLTYFWREFRGLSELQAKGVHQLELYANGLQSELDRFLYVPGLVELARDVLAVIEAPVDALRRQNANAYLERLNERAGTNVIYVLDVSGKVLASSNWQQPDSFVGMDFSFRPYFQIASHGERGRFFGVGTTSGQPGYYFSHPIRRDGKLAGVAAVKVSLDRVEQSWSGGEEGVLLADGHGVVVLASEPAWKFTTLRPLDEHTRAELLRTRQFDRKTLRRLDLNVIDELGSGLRIVSLSESSATGTFHKPAQEFLAQIRPMANSDWELMVLSKLDPVRVAALGDSMLAGVVAAFGWMLLLYLNERRRNIKVSLAAKEALERAYGELERRVRERTTDLTAANARLQAEIEERERTERHLQTTENELVQAGKLAVLGQLSTGITHELNQPLAALRTLSDNTIKFLQRGDLETAQANLTTIGQLVERMGHITGQLKVFARKAPSQPRLVEAHKAIRNALLLLNPRIRKEGVHLELDCPERSPTIFCDQNRLEQVLINLIGNALDATKTSEAKRLWVGCETDGDRVVIRVRDGGSGLTEEAKRRLFEPFFTTKEPGAGLGLGLAISSGIVRECGGTLFGDNHPEGGAIFCLELPLVPAEDGPA